MANIESVVMARDFKPRGHLFFVITSVERVVIANVVWRSVSNRIVSITTFHRNEKAHLKLKHNSVGQGRGGLEGTVRPSQLRAGSPPKKNLSKKNKSSRT